MGWPRRGGTATSGAGGATSRRSRPATAGRSCYALAATWRAHSCSGTGPNPGAFEIEEDEEKFTFRMNPCGSGQRLWRNGAYRGPHAMGVTEEAHDWSYGRKGFPLYCTHCSFMNEIQPIEWIGLPDVPVRSARRL